jgi:hypothetical protein
VEPVDHLRDVLAQRLLATLELLELEAAQGRGHAPPDLSLIEVGELHRGAPDVADEAEGPRPAQHDALGREPRLLVPRNHVEPQPRAPRDLLHEVGPVQRLAHRGGGHGHDALEPHPPRERREPAERIERPRGPRVEPPVSRAAPSAHMIFSL